VDRWRGDVTASAGQARSRPMRAARPRSGERWRRTSEIASIQLLSARDTLLDGALPRLGELRLTIIIWMSAVIRISCIEAQGKKTFRPAAAALFRQGPPIVPQDGDLRLSATARSSARTQSPAPCEKQQIPFASLRVDGP
jgi:hypothetical protein